MPLDDNFEAIGYVVGGWRYIFSRHYRIKKHREWREQGRFGMLMDVLFGAFGIAISLSLLSLGIFEVFKAVGVWPIRG